MSAAGSEGDGPIQVTAALVRREGRLLITLRPEGTHLEGHWEFPGGKLDPGETLEECVAREVEEETGLRIRVEEKAAEVVHHYPEKSVHLHFYRCRPAGGQARPIGCADLAWVLPAELTGYRFPPADARIIEDIATGRID